MSTRELIRFRCGRCGTGLKVSARKAGSSGTCPFCGSEVIAPHVSEATETGPVPEAEAEVEEVGDATEAAPARGRVGLLWVGALGMTCCAVLTLLVFFVPRSGKTPEATGADDRAPEASAKAKAATTPTAVASETPTPAPDDRAKPQDEAPAPAASQASSPTVAQTEPAPAAPAPPSAPGPRPRAGEVGPAIEKGLVLKGAVNFDTRTQMGFNTQTTIHQWRLALTLENQTGFTLDLGKDFLLYETNEDGSTFDGVGVFARPFGVTDASTYGFEYSYEMLDRMVMKSDGSITVGFSGARSKLDDLKPVPAGQSRSLRWTLEQMMWLRDELRVRLVAVLPEVQVTTDSGVERYRLVAYFPRPAAGTSWAVGKQTNIPMRAEHIGKLVNDPDTGKLTRLLAINWLAESDPQGAIPALVAVARPLREGQLLASCLEILTSLKGNGLAEQARALLAKTDLPNGIRNRAALYLGAVRDASARDLLIRSATDADNAVASGAIAALGTLGDAESVDALVKLLQDSRQTQRHSQIATSLAHTKTPRAIQTLTGRAQQSDKEALEALVSEGLPETFDFFVAMSKKPLSKEVRDQVARGLRSSGGERAIPHLMAMLEKDEAPDSKNPTQTDTVVDQLAGLNSKPEPAGIDFRHLDAKEDTRLPQSAPGKATRQLVALATSGNLRAVQVLAHSNDESAREPLQSLARTASGPTLQVVLDGLDRYWSASSFDLFVRGLKDPSPDVVNTAIQGFRKIKDPRVAELLAPLLRHADKTVRQSAASGLRDVKVGAPTLSVIADGLVKETNHELVDTLSEILIKGGWRDPAAIRPLGTKLQAAPDYQGYGYVRLLRHLSRDAMGPADTNEFYRDQKGWITRWVKWAREH